MSLHRCAACGSRNVVADTQTGGVSYNYKKGIVGAAVLGVGGAVAGVENKSQKVFKCPDCGTTLSYEMDDDIRTAIDIGLNNIQARSLLKISGVTIQWETLKARYKNIEEGFADKMVVDRKNNNHSILLSYAEATQEEFDEAVDMLVAFKKKVYDKNYKMTVSEYHALRNAVTVLIENMAKYRPDIRFGLGLGRWDRGEYLGLKRAFLEGCIWFYIFDIYNLYNDRYPTEVNIMGLPDRISEELKQWVKEYTLLPYFADYFFEDGDDLVDSDDILGCLSISSSKNYAALRFLVVYHRIELGDDYDYYDYDYDYDDDYDYGDEDNDDNQFDKDVRYVYTGCVVPRYIEKDGKLYCYRDARGIQKGRMKYIITGYFKRNPEKKAEFKSKIAARKKQNDEHDRNLQEKKGLEETISHNKNIIEQNSTEIARLRNKFFGRKAAFAKADELEQENRQLENDNAAASTRLQDLGKQISEHVASKEFYESLAKEMDYFVVRDEV